MKLAVSNSEVHTGKTLDLDCEQETMTVLNRDGRSLGTVSWDSVIDFIRSRNPEEETRYVRAYPRAPLALKVKYDTPEGQRFNSLTGGIGGGGMFIESSMPLPVGSEISLEFALPDRPLETIKAKARVQWVRTKPDRVTLYPGMGVQFTEIPSTARQNVIDLVQALNEARQVAHSG
jgi:type IV pilus assembly protein PilZ